LLSARDFASFILSWEECGLLIAYDEAAIAKPTDNLMNQVGVLLATKALYAEAEPLMRRALAIDKKTYGPDHPNVAIRLNNLAQLLQDTGRLTEAETLMRQALAIDEAEER
jgi:tetratricopeptide (TPR) repeat protein